MRVVEGVALALAGIFATGTSVVALGLGQEIGRASCRERV